MEVEEQLYCEALAELDEEHRTVFKAIFENGLNTTKASQLIGRSDKTAKKYYKEACKQVLKKMQS
ncbi:RNA polymerase sigma factor, sigma-70 family [Streptococcus pyogenes]|nr:RNA polymerase sigma factor, sigma-70 family [Streptococcus pyogenes]